MQTVKKAVIITILTSFLLLVIAFCTPGWALVKTTLNQLKQGSPEMKEQIETSQRRIEDMKEHGIAVPVLKDMSFGIGPFFQHYCMGMSTNGVYVHVCSILSSGNIIAILNIPDTGGTQGSPMQEVVQKMQENGQNFSKTTFIRIYVAIIVVCALLLIQSLVSVVLCIIYVCLRYPKKKHGFASGTSSIFSGLVGLILVVVALVEYVNIKNISIKELKDSFEWGFPYSLLLCFLASILFCASGIIVLRITVTSKPQFAYEMMVIDTGSESGTYVAKT